ncbi:MAG: serine/threonine protein kinase [Massilia sp.]|jgi:serine/threonine protein kinase|nr:serine/threonine protein kinase [Massilia sp.]
MLEAGAVITLEAGSYRLREALAGSAYGVVWCADTLPAGRQVALKLINQQQMARAHPDQRERWIASAHKEIAFLRSLEPWDERHIVRLLDTGLHDGLPVMALELLDGDLGKLVARERNAGRAIGFGQALDWLAQVNQALAKVHQYGWRYLDLKPSNVLIDARRGSVKLADFGTNRLLRDLDPHSYAGTANWQAPEQFFPAVGEAYLTDARSDYFALGAMFYYLVTGGLPLRFCRDCGQAYRDHQAGGAAVLRARHGGAIPPTLAHDEAALFLQRIDTGGAEALTLLRSLLCIERSGRPPHAIAISRMIGDVRAAMAAAWSYA